MRSVIRIIERVQSSDMSLLLAIYLKYFWFSIVLFAMLNAWFVQKRARPLIAENPLLQKDANRISLTLVLLMGIPSVMLGIIQLAAGYESPVFIFSDDLDNMYLLSAWFVMAGLRVFILYWLWFTDGLESYVAVTPLNLSKPKWLTTYLPSRIAEKPGIFFIRLIVSAVLVAWVGGVVFSFF